MDWDKVIELVLILIDRCMEKDDEATVLARLRDGGVRVRFAVRGILHEQGLRGPELWRAVRAVMDDLQTATDGELLSLIAQAKQR